ncbi:hypothetical protein IFR05_015976 [Cadophora sp. M221]|nr:hypothetical protein IFR05_015976 [Cadophora sp. M221]
MKLSFRIARGFIVSSLFTLVYGAAINTTVILPPGASNHGDPGLLCQPTKWTDVTIFFLGNYVGHAGTIVTKPGESVKSVLIASVFALLFPVTGLIRGLDAIRSMAVYRGKNDLEIAARSGALCVIEQDPDKKQTTRNVHGKYNLDLGYCFKTVGEEAKFEGEVQEPPNWIGRLKKSFKSPDSKQESVKISCSYDLVRILVAVGQTIFAVTTLYQTRGDQVEIYGYAAFGLTVAPYATMSVVNLLGHLARPRYPSMYIVQPHSQDNNNLHGIGGDVGKLQGPTNPYRTPNHAFELCGIVVFVSIQLAIIGGFSSFHGGSSTTAQRIWTMTWLVLGCFLVYVVDIETIYTWKYDLASNSYRKTRQGYLDAEAGLLIMWDRLRTHVDEVNNLHIADEVGNLYIADEESLEDVLTVLRLPEAGGENDPVSAQLAEIVDFMISLHGHIDKIISLKEGAGQSDQAVQHTETLNDMKRRLGPAYVRGMQQQNELLQRFLQTLYEADSEISNARDPPLTTLQNSLNKRRAEMETRRRRLQDAKDAKEQPEKLGVATLWIYGFCVLCGVPAIGGFVVVGQMLQDYGVCVRISR